jgi:hypothetical protein
MARGTESPVVRTWALATRHGRNHWRLAGSQERLDHPLVGIEGLVSQQNVGLHLRQQDIGAIEVMGLARRQQKGERVAQGIDQGMDLYAQSASAAPNRFVRLAIFFGAPVACWCARTMVLSIMAYSLSASAASTLNTFSQRRS